MLDVGNRLLGDAAALFSPRSSPLVGVPMETGCRLCVVVPARDERELIVDALQALAGQRDIDGSPLDPGCYEVIVLVNNCEDDTAVVARATQMLHPALRLHVVETHFPQAQAHIGVARRTLMDEGARRFWHLGRPDGVIVSTDADTVADPYWVAGTLAAVEAGSDVVGGRIVVDAGWSARGELSRQYHLRDVGYRSLVTELTARLDPDPADPWPRHFQHFGPSLAVTAAAYERAGGLPPLQSLEDVALYRALRRIDARIRHDPAVRVRTSSRSSTRTAFGFAAQLRDWSKMGADAVPQRVPQAGAVAARALADRELRQMWHVARSGVSPDSGAVVALAGYLAVNPAGLAGLLSRPSTFGCLLEQVDELQQLNGAWARRWPEVDIRNAIAGLREMLGGLRSASATLEQVEPIQRMPMPKQLIQTPDGGMQDRFVYGIT